MTPSLARNAASQACASGVAALGTPSVMAKTRCEQAGLLDRGRAAGAAGVIGVPVRLQARVGGRLEQERDVLAPVAGDDAVGAGRLDLGDVGREIGDLEQRMEFVADDLDVGPLLLEHGARRLRHRMAERIVLVDQIDLLDVRLGLHERRQRRHLDVGVGVPAEMPVRAFVVGQNRIDRGIIEIEDLLAGIAVVVLRHPVGQRCGDRRAIALGDEADALVGGLLRRIRLSCGFVLLSSATISTF